MLNDEAQTHWSFYWRFRSVVTPLRFILMRSPFSRFAPQPLGLRLNLQCFIEQRDASIWINDAQNWEPNICDQALDMAVDLNMTCLVIFGMLRWLMSVPHHFIKEERLS